MRTNELNAATLASLSNLLRIKNGCHVPGQSRGIHWGTDSAVTPINQGFVIFTTAVKISTGLSTTAHFAGLGVEPEALHLLGKCSTLSHTSVSLC